MQIFCKPSADQLAQFFRRGVGVVCQFGAAFVDILVPVLVNTSGQDVGKIAPKITAHFLALNLLLNYVVPIWNVMGVFSVWIILLTISAFL